MPQEFIITLGAVLSSLAVMFVAFYAVYKIAKKIDDAIGVDSQGRSLSERLNRVEHQLWENGGSSLADRVNTIETHVTSATAKLDIIENLLIGSSKIGSTRAPKPASIPAKKTRVKKAI